MATATPVELVPVVKTAFRSSMVRIAFSAVRATWPYADRLCVQFGDGDEQCLTVAGDDMARFLTEYDRWLDAQEEVKS